MQHPTVNQTSVVFSFAGDLWSVPRAGGDAVRLTNNPGKEDSPWFSPDGKTLAFTAEFEGNPEVYTMPAEGGVPQRLTYTPMSEQVEGWTHDGKSVIFSSNMESNTDYPYLFTVSVAGGRPVRLPFPCGTQASFSADGTRLAYNPKFRWQPAWKRYRGGQTSPVWIADLSNSKVKEVPRNNSNDSFPNWVGDKVYFLSDRNGPVSLFSYDTVKGNVSKPLDNTGFDMKALTSGFGVLAIEQLGDIKLYDIATGVTSKLNVQITGDFPESRVQYKDTSASIANAAISPSGVRAVFESRGDIYTVPLAKGDVKNLTQSSGTAERYPAWSPDGQSICYLSDQSGEYELIVRDAVGKSGQKSYRLGEAPAYYYSPIWSPDSSKISYADNKHNLWWLDLKSGKNTKIDTTPYENPTFTISASWSPDSQWVTYVRELDNHLLAAFLYSLESGKSTQLTDGMSNVKSTVFDQGGKYLYFTASTNDGPAQAWLDLSSYRALNAIANLYVVVLRNDLPSPLAPESDDEKPKLTPDGKPETAKSDFRIDLDRIRQRILALPVGGKNYVSLIPGPAESVFLVDVGPITSFTEPARLTLTKFTLSERTASPVTSDFQGLAVTPNGEKALIQRGPLWSISPTSALAGPPQGFLNLDGMRTQIDPKAEWRQMFKETWRIERDFLYAPNFHGIDLAAMKSRYEPFLDGVQSRDDLNYLFTDMLGEICVGHMFIGGGDSPNPRGVPVGLLGADYAFENGRYRFSRVYDGENWNPGLRAPLTQPGVNVSAGEYLLEVNGRNLTDKDNLNQLLDATAGKQVTIKVGPNSDGKESREVVVIPTASERQLRNLAWEEDNRRLVDKLSQGKIGYMHIPDTNIGGWTNFNRYFYAQIGKEGMVIDDRFNHGGQTDDFMTENLNRPLGGYFTPRYGKDITTPLSSVFGPKVLLINESAGSGGDYFPWHFRASKTGPLVGKRTWGGLVGILTFPTLVDGGSVTAPNIAFWNPNGTWDVENYGVDPDIEVELDPALWRKGHDPQLERAVEEAMRLLAKNPLPKHTKPPYQDKSSIDKIKKGS